MIIAGQHHEKIDGTGYPLGLAGSDLNQLARMATIIDIFSALTDRRVYKPPMEAEKALSIMNKMEGHVDMGFLAVFKEMLLDSVRES
jgi:HD-GYP domain-containing protein (c-di-GMP phosphodiesterase class II)